MVNAEGKSQVERLTAEAFTFSFGVSRAVTFCKTPIRVFIALGKDGARGINLPRVLR